MSFISDALERLRALVFRGRAEAELDEEFRFHIEREVEERVRNGADPGAARRDALVAFGGIERRKDEVREARGTQPVEEIVADIRHAARALRRDPIFAAASVLVLGLGIGATSAVFGIADAVLLSELPYREPDRIVRIYQAYSPENMFGLSVVDVQAIESQHRSFEAFGAMRPATMSLAGAGRPEQRAVARATAGFFEVLGVPAAVGRLLQPDDESPASDPVLVASHALAVQWFGSPQDAVGKSISVDGVGHTVIGVMPPRAVDMGGFRASAWIQMRTSIPPRRGPFGIRAFARLKPGVSVQDAARDLAGISKRIFPVWQASFRDSTTSLTPVPLRTAILGRNAERQVGLLSAGVILVLLVAIANVAMLMLVRVSAREPEFAVRSAHGAGRWRLARLVVAESLVIGFVAGLIGFAIATLLIRSAPALLPTLPRVRDVTANLGVAGAAAAGAFIAAAVASISPVLSVLARGANPSLIADKRVGSDRQTNFARSMLVAAEFGLALPLLFGAGLLLNSFLRLQNVDPGYNPGGTVVASIGLPSVRYPEPADLARYWRELEQRVSESPSVVAVGLSTSLPPDQPGDINNFDLRDRPVPPGGVEHIAPWTTVTNGYFTALEIPLLEGRLFTFTDTGGAPPVIVVSRAWAHKHYRNESAIGRELIAGGCTTCPPTTVVGVVGDVKYLGLSESAEAVYRPFAQAVPSSTSVVARTRAGVAPASALGLIRDIASRMDPEIPITESTLEAALAGSLADPRRWTTILGAFSIATVILATVGIFGLMAYTVRQRRREIGVRMALGAEPRAVIWMIVLRGMRYAVAGSVVGVAISLFSGRWISSFLFGVSALDPLTLVAVTLVLLGTAAVACWVAGRRAAAIHPVEAIASN